MHALVLITGLPGTGKSTLARAYAARYGALRLNSDIIRAELGLHGHYSDADKSRVYALLLYRAEAALRAGQMVLVDSTLYRADLRAPYFALAERLGVRLVLVELRADEAVIRARVGLPRPESEADFAVYEKLRDTWEPVPQLHLVLRTDTAPVETLVEQIHDYLHAH